MEQFSPQSSSSPANRGSCSPSVASNQVDASGLKMTISFKHKSPFYLFRQEPIPANEQTCAINLMASKGLEHSYNKLTTKKMKDSLSSFLPHMPGLLDTPGSQDNSSLRGIIDKPPVGGKELVLLNQVQLSGFRLHPGPLPEQYRALTQVQTKRRKKEKKHKHKGGETPGAEEGKGEEEREKKREKKHKKHDKDAEERKKKKKEKKKKRNKEDKDL